jgi:hypothetical protein
MQRRDAFIVAVCSIISSRLKQFLHCRNVPYPGDLHDIGLAIVASEVSQLHLAREFWRGHGRFRRRLCRSCV